MDKKNIMVLFGGCSTEHEVSKKSAATVISHLSEEKYNIIPVCISREGKWLLYDGHIENITNVQWEKFGTHSVLSPDRVNNGLLRIVGEKVKMIQVDVVFPVLHGKNGEDGTVQGLFELSGIPYVGCGVMASAIAMDKAMTKTIAKGMGIKQSEYMVFYDYQLEDPAEALKKIRYGIGYPCFVKPSNAGSSLGISKAGNKKELEEAIGAALAHDRKIVVEKAVKGREVECGVLGYGGPDTEASVVGEIVPGADFYDYDAKYNNSESRTIVPADLPEETSQEIRRIALDVFKAIGCSGLARVDFFVEEGSNAVIFNEINTMPGFTDISMYPMLWRVNGYDLPSLIDRLVDIGLGANRSQSGELSRSNRR